MFGFLLGFFFTSCSINRTAQVYLKFNRSPATTKKQTIPLHHRHKCSLPIRQPIKKSSCIMMHAPIFNNPETILQICTHFFVACEYFISTWNVSRYVSFLSFGIEISMAKKTSEKLVCKAMKWSQIHSTRVLYIEGHLFGISEMPQTKSMNTIIFTTILFTIFLKMYFLDDWRRQMMLFYYKQNEACRNPINVSINIIK